ncbi:NPCBM/NEW2 domain-containing protein [Paenibacillus shenyangensis]|uniref:NPCBM/NEW2 domain-containing protein n=1 Tax=Paenibacillus sp. A9 TaxID=1284352 RepID=UPI00037A03E8|nr:stalk domain-containing protein [Paenibacillus sp. A9]
MSAFKKIKYSMVGFTLGAVFFGSIAFAATTKIEVSLDPIKFVVDNVDKTPLNGNFNNNGTSVPASLSYKGTTYVPLKMVGNMVDKNVAWDGKTKSVLIGNSAAAPVYLTDLAPMSISSDSVTINKETSIGDQSYKKTFVTNMTLTKKEAISYNLKGQYKTFSFGYHVGDEQISTIVIYGDGKELWSGLVTGGTPLQNESISVSGVQELKVSFERKESGTVVAHPIVVNPILIK